MLIHNVIFLISTIFLLHLQSTTNVANHKHVTRKREQKIIRYAQLFIDYGYFLSSPFILYTFGYKKL